MQDDTTTQISLKSNRGFMIKLAMTFFVIWALFVIAMSIGLAVDYEEAKDSLYLLIISAAFAVVCAALSLIFKFYKGKRYEFSKEEIVCYKRDKEIDRISVSDIEHIDYYQFKLWFIFPMFLAASAPRKGSWKLHIILNNGTKKELALFSTKDAKLLNEKLYGDLLSVNPAI